MLKNTVYLLQTVFIGNYKVREPTVSILTGTSTKANGY